MSNDLLEIPMSARPFVAGAQLLPENMTCRQMAILLLIAAHPGNSVKHIAATLDLSKPVITRASDKLVDLKLVRRKISTMDRRQVELYVTTDGVRLLRAAGLLPAA